MARGRGVDGGSDGGRTIAVGFVALVGASGGMLAAGADGSLVGVGIGVVGGVVVGAALLWYLHWMTG